MTASQQEWQSWLHDPRHWDKFYNRVGMKTYAAIGREILTGRPPAEAVERAVDGISRQMRDSALPEEVIGAYRDEYSRHRDHLLEIAQEIAATVPLNEPQEPPAPRHEPHREKGVPHAPLPHPAPPAAENLLSCPSASVMEPWLWLTRLQATFALEYMHAATTALRAAAHEIEVWSSLIAHHPDYRHHAAHFRSSDLMHHYGRRNHDVDVERL